MVDSTPLIRDSRVKKQGHRILCCCDSRKAVIMINLLGLVLVAAGLIAAAVQRTLVADIPSIIAYVISILFYFIVMCSALQFHRCAVIVAIIWQLVAIVWLSVGLAMNGTELAKEANQTQTDWIIFLVVWYVIHVFILYAEWVYVSEVGKGIMSRETHSREKYSW